MRIEGPGERASVVGAIAALIVCLWLSGGLAQTPPDAVLLFAASEPLVVEQRAELSLRLTPPPGGRAWMITLRGEGTAIEVVRGRLLPSDVVDSAARPLTLRVPIVARRPGVALVHAELSGWSCQALCRKVNVTATTTLHVNARPQG